MKAKEYNTYMILTLTQKRKVIGYYLFKTRDTESSELWKIETLIVKRLNCSVSSTIYKLNKIIGMKLNYIVIGNQHIQDINTNFCIEYNNLQQKNAIIAMLQYIYS